MKAKDKDQSTEIVIQEINTGVLEICVLGTQPLIMNRMSEKAWRELLMPSPKKNRAEKASTLKHSPIDEYRASVYQINEARSPTALVLPVQYFKNSALVAALDMAGTNKSQMGRLIWVRERWVPVYGVPQLSMMIVRMGDIRRTPDVRTRAILPQWAAKFSIEFVKPILSAQSVINVIAAGGLVAGVGDFRQEKGKGNFGQFILCQEDDPTFREVMRHGGRTAQLAALESPLPYDEEAAELLSWYDQEVTKRGRDRDQAPSGLRRAAANLDEPLPPPKHRKRRGNGKEVRT